MYKTHKLAGSVKPTPSRAVSSSAVAEDLTGTAFDLQGVPHAAPYPDHNPVEDPSGVARDMTDITMPSKMLAGMVNIFANADRSTMAKMYYAVMNQFGPNASPGEPDDKVAAMNQASIAMKGNPLDGIKEFTQEQTREFFSQDATLTEEFKDKAIVLFEATVSNAIKVKTMELQEDFEKSLIKEVQVLREELTTSVEDYIKYACEEWIAANKLAIEEGMKADVVTQFIGKMKKLFGESHIMLPEADISAIAAAEKKIDILKEENDKLLKKIIELNNAQGKDQFDQVLEQLNTKLSVNEQERFRSLTEEFYRTCKTPEDFKRKAELVFESYFSARPGSNLITEDNENGGVNATNGTLDPWIANAVRHISGKK
jgi:hypothetical protein